MTAENDESMGPALTAVVSLVAAASVVLMLPFFNLVGRQLLAGPAGSSGAGALASPGVEVTLLLAVEAVLLSGVVIVSVVRYSAYLSRQASVE